MEGSFAHGCDDGQVSLCTPAPSCPLGALRNILALSRGQCPVVPEPASLTLTTFYCIFFPQSRSPQVQLNPTKQGEENQATPPSTESFSGVRQLCPTGLPILPASPLVEITSENS